MCLSGKKRVHEPLKDPFQSMPPGFMAIEEKPEQPVVAELLPQQALRLALISGNPRWVGRTPQHGLKPNSLKQTI
ncbi:MAG TPA: hypothetical protein DCG19_13165 [Cryomorphaceae bacterium]|nr:hypothetical protein [Owenweeksia sp.]MBG00310.1 hypothetical protein [Owenweeksia sp.]HAD98353.1 hypothetical protein [Cryomorphaceae bacterium]HBF18962.1 hypothetical protein [Cryomorphaceae bacterium]HCQ16265.1 hypothetical protein [Cryomorphaceae bacterium]